MRRRMNRSLSLGAVGISALVVGAIVALPLSPRSNAEESTPDAALERTRDQVKMLDELYKTAVVSITNRYDGQPAIKVAIDVFKAMEKSGRHKAKLVDATGSPQNEANLPATDFEKRAEKAIREGKAYYEEVSNGKPERTLYVATVVPAVTKKCATCHGIKTGDLLGFIRYEVPIK